MGSKEHFSNPLASEREQKKHRVDRDPLLRRSERLSNAGSIRRDLGERAFERRYHETLPSGLEHGDVPFPIRDYERESADNYDRLAGLGIRFRRPAYAQNVFPSQGAYSPVDENSVGARFAPGSPEPTVGIRQGYAPNDAEFYDEPSPDAVFGARDVRYGAEDLSGMSEWEMRQLSRGRFAGVGPRNYVRSDERVLEWVCERLMLHKYLDPSDIDVTVQGGEVTLEGTVQLRAEKYLAEDLAAHVPGVEDVNNRLKVGRASRASERNSRSEQQNDKQQPESRHD
ncbi:MAG: BON domain-containing protein [Bdellovibrionales bacterium]|nr:BON domain-containing protein [Bdellovibrionales bacterium]